MRAGVGCLTSPGEAEAEGVEDETWRRWRGRSWSWSLEEHPVLGEVEEDLHNTYTHTKCFIVVQVGH